MVSPVLFVVSIVTVELFLGEFTTSERSDAVGSWAPWVTAVFVLLSPAVVKISQLAGAHLSRLFTKISRFVQYSKEERRQLGITPRPQPIRTKSSLTALTTHARYGLAQIKWYLKVRAKAFKAWWKDPEKLSATEYSGYGVLDA